MEKLLVKTKAGLFLLEATPRGLSRLYFPSQFHKGNRVSQSASPSLKKIGKLLKDYFGDPNIRLDRIRMDLRGTHFEKQVYQTLRTIGYRLVSYSEIARRSGFPGAGRAVGSAMRKNLIPIFLPCHRVIKKDRKIGCFSAGAKWKKFLLKHEGLIKSFLLCIFVSGVL